MNQLRVPSTRIPKKPAKHSEYIAYDTSSSEDTTDIGVQSVTTVSTNQCLNRVKRKMIQAAELTELQKNVSGAMWATVNDRMDHNKRQKTAAYEDSTERNGASPSSSAVTLEETPQCGQSQQQGFVNQHSQNSPEMSQPTTATSAFLAKQHNSFTETLNTCTNTIVGTSEQGQSDEVHNVRTPEATRVLLDLPPNAVREIALTPADHEIRETVEITRMSASTSQIQLPTHASGQLSQPAQLQDQSKGMDTILPGSTISTSSTHQSSQLHDQSVQRTVEPAILNPGEQMSTKDLHSTTPQNTEILPLVQEPSAIAGEGITVDENPEPIVDVDNPPPIVQLNDEPQHIQEQRVDGAHIGGGPGAAGVGNIDPMEPLNPQLQRQQSMNGPHIGGEFVNPIAQQNAQVDQQNDIWNMHWFAAPHLNVNQPLQPMNPAQLNRVPTPQHHPANNPAINILNNPVQRPPFGNDVLQQNGYLPAQFGYWNNQMVPPGQQQLFNWQGQFYPPQQQLRDGENRPPFPINNNHSINNGINEMKEQMTEGFRRLERGLQNVANRQARHVLPPDFLKFSSDETLQGFEHATEEDYRHFVTYLSQIGGKDIRQATTELVRATLETTNDYVRNVTVSRRERNKLMLKEQAPRYLRGCLTAIRSHATFRGITDKEFNAAMTIALKTVKESLRQFRKKQRAQRQQQ